MYTSIRELYDNPLVPMVQVDYFWSEFRNLFSSEQDKEKLVSKILHYIWVHYDYGGISCRRSLRCDLLDKAREDIKSNNIENAKKIIALLVAMYHNHEHMRKYDWYDFKLETLYESSLEIRVKLSVVAYIFHAENEIPDISNFKHEDFLEFLK